MSEETHVERMRTRRLRSSLFWPLIFIAVGVFFLLTNLNVVKGDAWELLSQWWPVLLILMGLDGLWQGSGVAGPVLLAGAGVVFLLGNFNLLAINPWELLLRLWPVFLIAIGIDVVVARRSVVASLVGLVVVLVILGGALAFSGVVGAYGTGTALPTEKVSQALDGSESARVQIEPGAGGLVLKSGAEAGMLITGQAPTGRGHRVSQEFNQSGTQANYRIWESGTNFFLGRQDQKWDLAITKDVPLALDVNLGAGQATLNLTGLQLSSLSMDMGVGETIVTLPETGSYSAKVNGGIGHLVINVPPGVGLRVKASAGLGGVDAPNSYARSGETYTSPGFDTAASQVEMELSSGIGSIEIRQQ